MKRVSSTIAVRTSLARIRAELTPTAIVESGRAYEVGEVRETDDGWEVLASLAEVDEDVVFVFEKTPTGYSYELANSGLFEELSTELSIEQKGTEDGTGPDDVDDDSEQIMFISMTSEYTFGGLLAPIYDWLAQNDRKRELVNVLVELGDEIGDIVPDPDVPGTTSAGEQRVDNT